MAALINLRPMALHVGYACVHTQLPSASRTMRLANATPERLREVTELNLDALETILRWNLEQGIQVFRLSSNTIPFGSHPVNELRWWNEFARRLDEIGALMEGMSISTHPGQYTVLGSARPEVVDASLAELEYQARLLMSFGLDQSHKMVIHLSGTVERFLAAAERLSPDARGRLVVENDERWSLGDVLPLEIDLDGLRHTRRAFARPCLDWTERRHHLAGALGAAIATGLFELGWIARTGSGRAVRLTPAGERGLVLERIRPVETAS